MKEKRKSYFVMAGDKFINFVGIVYKAISERKNGTPTIVEVTDELNFFGVSANPQYGLKAKDVVGEIKYKEKKSKSKGDDPETLRRLAEEREKRKAIIEENIKTQRELRPNDPFVGSPSGKSSGKEVHSYSKGISDDDTS